MGDDINEYFANYQNTCNDLNALDNQRLNYLHNLFDKGAERLYRNFYYPRATSFHDACEYVCNELNSETRQNRIRNYPQSLHVTKTMIEKNKSVNEAVEFIKERIIKLKIQGPNNHRRDVDLVEYMHDAVAGLDWDRTAITQCATAQTSSNIQMFSSALEILWLHCEGLIQAKRLLQKFLNHRDDSLPDVM